MANVAPWFVVLGVLAQFGFSYQDEKIIINNHTDITWFFESFSSPSDCTTCLKRPCFIRCDRIMKMVLALTYMEYVTVCNDSTKNLLTIKKFTLFDNESKNKIIYCSPQCPPGWLEDKSFGKKHSVRLFNNSAVTNYGRCYGCWSGKTEFDFAKGVSACKDGNKTNEIMWTPPKAPSGKSLTPFYVIFAIFALITVTSLTTLVIIYRKSKSGHTLLGCKSPTNTLQSTSNTFPNKKDNTNPPGMYYYNNAESAGSFPSVTTTNSAPHAASKRDLPPRPPTEPAAAEGGGHNHKAVLHESPVAAPRYVATQHESPTPVPKRGQHHTERQPQPPPPPGPAPRPAPAARAPETAPVQQPPKTVQQPKAVQQPRRVPQLPEQQTPRPPQPVLSEATSGAAPSITGPTLWTNPTISNFSECDNNGTAEAYKPAHGSIPRRKKVPKAEPIVMDIDEVYGN